MNMVLMGIIFVLEWISIIYVIYVIYVIYAKIWTSLLYIG